MATQGKRRSVIVKKGTGPRVFPPKLWDQSKPPGGRLPKTKPDSKSLGEKTSKRNVPVIKGTAPRKAPPKADFSGKPPGACLSMASQESPQDRPIGRAIRKGTGPKVKALSEFRAADKQNEENLSKSKTSSRRRWWWR